MKHIVHYTGPTQHTRQLSVADLEGAGIISDRDLEWSLANRHRVILDGPDQSLLDFFGEDPDFEVSEVKNAEAKEVAEKIADGEPLEGDEVAPPEPQTDTTGSEAQAGTTAGRGARSTATS